jgi:hypothetical protein
LLARAALSSEQALMSADDPPDECELAVELDDDTGAPVVPLAGLDPGEFAPAAAAVVELLAAELPLHPVRLSVARLAAATSSSVASRARVRLTMIGSVRGCAEELWR